VNDDEDVDCERADVHHGEDDADWTVEPEDIIRRKRRKRRPGEFFPNCIEAFEEPSKRPKGRQLTVNISSEAFKAGPNAAIFSLDDAGHAQPLLFAAAANVESQLCQYLKACSFIYGLPSHEVLLCEQVADHLGLQGHRLRRRRAELAALKELANKSDGELEAILDELDAPPPPHSDEGVFQVNSGQVDWTLTKELPRCPCKMALVSFQTSGHNLGMALDSHSMAMTAMIDIWSGGRFKRHQELLKAKFEAAITFVARKEAAKKLLDDSENQLRGKLSLTERSCSDCGRVLPSATAEDLLKLEAHAAAHNFFAAFSCDCQVATTTPDERRAHVELAHLSGLQACSWCGFATLPAGGAAPCRACGCKAAQNSAGKSLVIQEDREFAETCDVCGKRFTKHANFHTHRKSHTLYTCELCGETLQGYNRLRKHRKIAHPDPTAPKSYPCEVCGKMVKSAQRLREHIMRMHVPDGERPHQCPHCDRGFGLRGELVAHMNVVHLKSRPYPCRYGCGEAFNHYATRGDHEKSKHGKKLGRTKAM